jgi:hypothetical protein
MVPRVASRHGSLRVLANLPTPGKVERQIKAIAGPENCLSEYRSSYGSMRDEFPFGVYRSRVRLDFVWMILAAWLAFGGAPGTDLDLAIATVAALQRQGCWRKAMLKMDRVECPEGASPAAPVRRCCALPSSP